MSCFVKALDFPITKCRQLIALPLISSTFFCIHITTLCTQINYIFHLEPLHIHILFCCPSILIFSYYYSMCAHINNVFNRIQGEGISSVQLFSWFYRTDIVISTSQHQLYPSTYYFSFCWLLLHCLTYFQETCSTCSWFQSVFYLHSSVHWAYFF